MKSTGIIARVRYQRPDLRPGGLVLQSKAHSKTSFFRC
ncbi:hypothetical protein PAMC26510_30000 [Caballeronia sordidicola]|uniref:Uncharacterized protein n=1 Tax=Caballeronia sordidicola TaxID=196367 RepID=A0A242M9Q5_CABSO|nr:hypothetical protein PAMC26510_30000 [Caballeronia sordidicola]